jgi:hypothetical protein
MRLCLTTEPTPLWRCTMAYLGHAQTTVLSGWLHSRARARSSASATARAKFCFFSARSPGVGVSQPLPTMARNAMPCRPGCCPSPTSSAKPVAARERLLQQASVLSDGHRCAAHESSWSSKQTQANAMAWIPTSIALLLGVAAVAAVAWGLTCLARIVDGLAVPHDAAHFNAEDVQWVSDELWAR